MRVQMEWKFVWPRERLPVAIFVSRYQHCLLDLLQWYQVGELPGEIAMVVSNHRDAAMASYDKVPFHFFPLDSLNQTRMQDCEMEMPEPRDTDLELRPLSHAAGWHLNHRILFYGNKTVVFD